MGFGTTMFDYIKVNSILLILKMFTDKLCFEVSVNDCNVLFRLFLFVCILIPLSAVSRHTHLK